jgi:hypothetical protein
MYSSESTESTESTVPVLPRLRVTEEAISASVSPSPSGSSELRAFKFGPRISIGSDLSQTISDAGSWLSYVDSRERKRLRSARRRLAQRVYQFDELPPVAICKCDEEHFHSASWAVDFTSLQDKDRFHSVDQEKLRQTTRDLLRCRRNVAHSNDGEDNIGEHHYHPQSQRGNATHPIWWTPQAPEHKRTGFAGRRRYGVAKLDISKQHFIVEFIDAVSV